MADESKTVAEWEKQAGIMFYDVAPNKKLTQDEFKELYRADHDAYVGVDHEAREKWLRDNGYEVTRANMMDTTLATPEPADDESK